MGEPELLSLIDADVMLAARRAARRTDARFVIGWWNDGDERRMMVLPEGHHVTAEFHFLPLMLVSPTGRTEPLASLTA